MSFLILTNVQKLLISFFAGPPYALQTIDDLPALVIQKQLLNPDGWFVLEHTVKNSYQGYPMYVTTRNYGTTLFSIFVNKANA